MIRKKILIIMSAALLVTAAACSKDNSEDTSDDIDISIVKKEAKQVQTDSSSVVSNKTNSSLPENENGGELLEDEEITYDTLHGMRLDYKKKALSSLSTSAIPWGMGPDRDKKNRPMTAIQYQKKYKKYNVDFIITKSKKKIYLTFDEGYENGFTKSILDTLKKHDATAVFFVTKPYVESNKKLVKRMIKEGHVVGNHTVHHPSDGLQAYSKDYQKNEVMELHKYVKKKFDYDMFLFRYPTGKFSEQSLAIVSNCGYRSVFWSFAYADWDRNNQPAPADALKKVEDSLHPGAIYLLHAVSETNAAILDDFLTYVESEGYDYGNYGELLLKNKRTGNTASE